ncbi:MAG: hypothetical protein JWM78_1877 [Verrucomicrobiaceae bacterium]|nr:hypothetical protein [Verrucomicrobiaceae bacterium]
MDSVSYEICTQIKNHLKNLYGQAVGYQAIYTDKLNRECKNRKVSPSGFFPRIRGSRNEGFYLYWDKYLVRKGSTKLEGKRQQQYRISQSVPKRKTEPVYPASVFVSSGIRNWELAIVLEAEYVFAPIRREANFWMKNLNKLSRGA